MRTRSFSRGSPLPGFACATHLLCPGPGEGLLLPAPWPLSRLRPHQVGGRPPALVSARPASSYLAHVGVPVSRRQNAAKIDDDSIFPGPYHCLSRPARGRRTAVVRALVVEATSTTRRSFCDNCKRVNNAYPSGTSSRAWPS